ncbi:PhzF family phenazine biosynthesis protein [Tardiphaga robiniae]|uniref:PhzF family phenazine biosynthesis protein n=1 Tax=Tardiphaga robiniae TaxID=943830 RepID=A0A161SSB4_9BRAD|nr:PhzF family phenazine biosynthesis protein [Tardiphaga robiniae]KZD24192.1 PhzF family phenazine biosynthesis protein [Tardiphaga robiniae]
MIDYVTVDVFTDTRFGGNPLAVIPDARAIDDALLQKIATEFNYSETTFVFPSDDPAHTARVRIFTPTDEIPFAGHPNVGTAYVLGRRGTIFGKPTSDHMVFEEKAGLVHLDLLRDGGVIVGTGFVAPQPLTMQGEIDRDMMAACISLAPDAIVTSTHGPRMVSVGLPFAVAELASLDALASAQPNAVVFEQAERKHRSRDDRFSTFIYVRTGDGFDHLRARMFAPLDNVSEDPATGSASGALAAYLVSLDPRRDTVCGITIEQGVEMGRRSLIEVEVRKRDGHVESVRISGRCVPVMQGRIDL